MCPNQNINHFFGPFFVPHSRSLLQTEKKMGVEKEKFLRKGKERKGKERKGKERKGKERKGKERKGSKISKKIEEGRKRNCYQEIDFKLVGDNGCWSTEKRRVRIGRNCYQEIDFKLVGDNGC